jgi:hypothetical protein
MSWLIQDTRDFFEGCYEEIDCGRICPEARNIPADGQILGPFAAVSKGRLEPTSRASWFFVPENRALPARRLSFASKPDYGDRHPLADPVQ